MPVMLYISARRMNDLCKRSQAAVPLLNCNYIQFMPYFNCRTVLPYRMTPPLLNTNHKLFAVF